MKRDVILRYLILLLCLTCSTLAKAQNTEVVRWISFEQLDDSLAANPKKVFIDFYTDWCTYCRKMDKRVFTNTEVVTALNRDYYAVKMNAEAIDSISFEGQIFVNDQVGQVRNPIHQLAQLLAIRNGQFTPPVLLVLDEQFTVKQRHFQYLDSKKLLKVLRP